MKVKTNDKILVITGKDKGKNGRVSRVIAKHNQIVVEKINMRTKHVKKTTAGPGEKIHFEAPINASNVAIICPSCSKPTRAGYKLTPRPQQSEGASHQADRSVAEVNTNVAVRPHQVPEGLSIKGKKERICKKCKQTLDLIIAEKTEK